jgi:hypothetical protein
MFTAASVFAQSAAKPIAPNGAAKAANTQSAYAALRSDLPGSEGVMVKNFTLEREGGKFTFEQGDFYFYAPVEGRVTGAVFVGKGGFDLTGQDMVQQRALALLTKKSSMQEEFTTLVLRFADDTADEIRKASVGASKAPPAEVRAAAEELANGFRKNLHNNVDLRLLADVLGDGADGLGDFFLASFRMGDAATGRNVLFLIDPEGTFHASPDEVELSTWNGDEVRPWLSYLMENAKEDDLGNRVQVTDERLDVTFDPAGTMKSSAETTMKVLRDGMRVVRLNLYPTLRVSGVYSEDGTALDFVQEAKENDAEFAVVLPKAAKAGDTLRLLTVYSGGDALKADGNNTYHLVTGAEDSWYPSGLGERADSANFHMTFHLPKNLQLVASGKQVSLSAEGDGMQKAVWETQAPITVAGFNLGDFKTGTEQITQGPILDAYSDVDLPDLYKTLLQTAAPGNQNTAQALKTELSQGKAAMQLYSDYFGKLPYDHMALAQQSGCNYGHIWPMLVSLPICGFWDPTVQQKLGMFNDSYWGEVTPTEVAHQWWGGLVGFYNYRDQWLSNGLSSYSVGIFLNGTSAKPEDYREFWKEKRRILLTKNDQGVRPFDLGPLTMGELGTDRKPGEDPYQVLMTNKGAYVVHMLDMLYWTPAFGDKPFKLAMQKFVRDFAGKTARTEDFKAAMERSMSHAMDLQFNGKLDWFFNEYVYGTELPHYTISSEFSVDDKGITSVRMRLTQSNVSANFVMLIPIYLEVKTGEVHQIFKVVIHGNGTIDTSDKPMVLGKLPTPAKALLINYNSDVLSDE